MKVVVASCENPLFFYYGWVGREVDVELVTPNGYYGVRTENSLIGYIPKGHCCIVPNPYFIFDKLKYTKTAIVCQYGTSEWEQVLRICNYDKIASKQYTSGQCILTDKAEHGFEEQYFQLGYKIISAEEFIASNSQEKDSNENNLIQEKISGRLTDEETTKIYEGVYDELCKLKISCITQEDKENTLNLFLGARFIDIRVRKDGREYFFEGEHIRQRFLYGEKQ